MPAEGKIDIQRGSIATTVADPVEQSGTGISPAFTRAFEQERSTTDSVTEFLRQQQINATPGGIAIPDGGHAGPGMYLPDGSWLPFATASGGGGVDNGGRDGGGGRGGGGGGGPEGPRNPERELNPNPERENPDVWIAILQEISQLPAEARELRNGQFMEARAKLKSYGDRNKLQGENANVVIAKDGLDAVDEAEISRGNRPEEEQVRLRNLLDDLDSFDQQLIWKANSLAVEETYTEFPLEIWDEIRREQAELRQQRTAAEGEINTLVSPNFLENRRTAQAQVRRLEAELAVFQRAIDEAELRELRAEPEEIELGLEHRLINPDVVLGEAPTRTFAQVINSLNQLEQARVDGSPNFREAYLVQARNELAWYFHHGRELHVVKDLDNKLGEAYRKWAISILASRETGQPGLASDLRARTAPKSFGDVMAEINEYFAPLLDQGSNQHVENSTNWDLVRGEDLAYAQSANQPPRLTSQERARMQGLRAEFVRRAKNQMLYSLRNLSEGLEHEVLQARREQQGLAPLPELATIPIDIIPGEWNVRLQEGRIDVIRDEQEREKISQPLWEQKSYYLIEIKGNTREQVARGADQAADNIIQSAITFDLNLIQQKMSYLLEGIQYKIADIQKGERISETEAEAVIAQIRRSVANKMDFFILDFLAANMMMDQFSNHLSSRMKIDGVEKFKILPLMNDGLMGVALNFLNDPLFQLYYRPEGWKGQMQDDDTLNKLVRTLLKKRLVNLLMEFEFKGDTPSERAQSRDNLRLAHTREEFMQNFERRGFIPKNVIPAESPYRKHPLYRDNPQNQYLTYRDYLTIAQDLQGRAVLDTREYKSIERYLTAGQRVEYRQAHYEQIKREVGAPGHQANYRDLIRLREARRALSAEKYRKQDIKTKALSAATTALQVMDTMGESAFIGQPALVMENGDFIRKEDAVLFYKYTVLEAGKLEFQDYDFEDNEALIRWRAKKWRDALKEAGLDRDKARDLIANDPKFRLSFVLPAGTRRAGETVQFELQEGFEETGLTKEEFLAFVRAVHELRRYGHTAEMAGKKFEEIIQMSRLKPILNGFLADYNSAESQLDDEYVVRMAAKMEHPVFRNIRDALGFKGRERVNEENDQDNIFIYTQKVEDSRSFHVEMDRMAKYVATHPSIFRIKQISDLKGNTAFIYPTVHEEDGEVVEVTYDGTPVNNQGQPTQRPRNGKVTFIESDFTSKYINFGFRNQRWGPKRLSNLPEFWYTNQERTIPRAVDLVHVMPFYFSSLSQELFFGNILELCLNSETGGNGMESIDNPILGMFGERVAAMVGIRKGAEGGMVPGQSGGWKKIWGFFEKPLTDANSLWRLLQGAISNVSDKEIIKSLLESPTTVLREGDKEKWIEHLQDTTFSRFLPIITGTEIEMGEMRQALSSGAGYDENEKFALRYFEWVLSEKNASARGRSGREDGGMIVQKEIRDILRFITIKGTYRPDASLFDEYWRKQTPSHNPRYVGIRPEFMPTYLAA